MMLYSTLFTQQLSIVRKLTYLLALSFLIDLSWLYFESNEPLLHYITVISIILRVSKAYYNHVF
jgi:hypothetical protein